MSGGLFGAGDFKEKEAGFAGADVMQRKPTLFDDPNDEADLKNMM